MVVKFCDEWKKKCQTSKPSNAVLSIISAFLFPKREEREKKDKENKETTIFSLFHLLPFAPSILSLPVPFSTSPCSFSYWCPFTFYSSFSFSSFTLSTPSTSSSMFLSFLPAASPPLSTPFPPSLSTLL